MDLLKGAEHKIKAAFFSAARPWLKRGSESFVPLDGHKIKKILFLRPEKIGDMVISFPVFDALLNQFPRMEISILGSPRNIAIIKDDPRFCQVFLYTKSLADIGSIRRMRREQFDCVVDMICDDSVTALILSQLCAPGKPRIGIGKKKYKEFYDFNYDHRMGNQGHIIENTLKLLDAFNLRSSEVSCFAPPWLDDQSEQSAADFLSGINNGSGRSMTVGYNLSAGSPTRVWAEEKSVRLVQMILEHRRARVILFTTPDERDRGERIRSHFEDSVYLIPDGLSLVQVCAIIKRLDLLITPDTSLVHIARSFKVAVVGLYSRYMKNFLLWRPYGQKGGSVVSQCDGNIFDITPEQVIESFDKVISSQDVGAGI